MGIAGWAIIIITVLFSYKGFNNPSLYEAYKFDTGKLLISKDYKRLITSGFLHVSWLHLIFNMLSLYLFCGSVELYLGEFRFLIIYFISMVGGNLFSLFIHRHHSGYTAVGASGAVCGIMFATIALFPGMSIGFFGLPFHFPAWLYGLVFVLYSIYGIKSKRDDTGHEAHLGGALIGLITAILMVPSSLTENFLPILVIIAPSALFIYLIITRPNLLLINMNLYKRAGEHSIDYEYNNSKKARQDEVDKLLEKIHRKGMSSLSKKEKQLLHDYSKNQ